MTSVVTIRLVVHGRVQGVSFRRWTVAAAKKKGLNGWVRNRKDGSVEMALSGPDAAIQSMKQACLKGPTFARVTQIEEKTCDEPLSAGFETRPTL